MAQYPLIKPHSPLDFNIIDHSFQIVCNEHQAHIGTGPLFAVLEYAGGSFVAALLRMTGRLRAGESGATRR
jgi:hypothetical protein